MTWHKRSERASGQTMKGSALICFATIKRVSFSNGWPKVGDGRLTSLRAHTMEAGGQVGGTVCAASSSGGGDGDGMRAISYLCRRSSAQRHRSAGAVDALAAAG